MLRFGWIASLLLALAYGPAEAATYDPDLRWRTLRTEHFDIHFHQGVEQVADEVSTMVEEAYDTITNEIAWTPRPRIHVVLIDRTDDANGFASAAPYPQITIYVTAPGEDSSLQLYEDWSKAIFLHELTHVVHMDTNHGIVRALRAVIGRVASTNDVSPAWMIEGYATFQETRQTAAGRGRATWPDMQKRTAVLADAFPPLGNLDGFQPDPPGGNLRYIWGQDFIQYVADQTGEDVWTRWVHTYGGWVPFWLPSKRVFGKRLVPLYFDWRASETAQYEQQAARIRAEGETVGRVVSDPKASCVAPAFSPDGERLVWSCYDLRTGNALWMSDGDGFGAEIEVQDFGAGYFTWRADSKAFVFASVHLVNQFNTWSDIYLYSLGGSITSLTSGARARDPDFSPDGSRLLYVTNRAQDNQLETMTVDRRQNSLTDQHDHTQFGTPRFSPDGRAVALSVWEDGRRDLWLYDPEGRPMRRLTADTAIDADPVWSKDGRWLFFTSDRSGVPNVYAIELASERLWQVTNVTTGAARPSIHPSGERLAYMEYSQDGWDIVVLDLANVEFRDRGLLPRPVSSSTPIADLVGSEPVAVIDAASWDSPTSTDARVSAFRPVDPFGGAAFEPSPQSSEVVDNFEDAVVEDAFGEEKTDYPFRIQPKRYNPLPTLPPRYVLPYFQTTPFAPGPAWDFTCLHPTLACAGVQATVSTSASDPIRRFGWNANVNYRTDAEFAGGGASFTVNRFLPVYSMGVSTRAVPATRLLFFDPEAPTNEFGELVVGETDPPTIYWEKRSTAYAVVSFPYQLRTTVFAQYSFTDRRPRYPLPSNTWLPGVPLVGYVGALSGGWRYSFSQPTSYAISVEDGRVVSVVGSLLHPWLGTWVRNLETGASAPFTQVQVTGEIRRYWVTPWVPNHVVAVRGAGGVTFGASDFLGNYQLGGSIGDSGFLVTPDEFRMVRGYPFAADIGDMYWLAAGEYRFPLWRVERGLGTLPVYARTLSASVFADAGNAFVSPTLSTGVPASANEFFDAAVQAPLVGVGAELTFRTVVSWGIGLNGRLGYAVGLTEGGYKPEQGIEPLYLRLGGSF